MKWKRSMLVLVCLALVIPVLLLAGCGKEETKKTPEKNLPEISAEPRENKVKVTLYFADDQAQYLIPEDREVVKGNETIEEVVVNELIKGPSDPKHGRTIPEGTKLDSINIAGEVAYVSFSKELKTNHWGGSAGELMTVYSIVNSLTALEGIKEVQILIEGKKLETLGNMDLSIPLKPSLELLPGGEE
ncbi:GerMN domain-containing protein [Desulfolucanica intricata]|uniref:GerMN domain-containing protein n=1 Tax=Desulfolucanica intricata TaxID=1285191 RepID=UPI000835A1F0|nr:GerMN domain-containing protein [Desulfolucanica intricata]